MKLSKTNFITYLDCVKNAWLKIHKPDIYNKYPLSAFELNIIEAGNEIDKLARDLYPEGVLVTSQDDVRRTHELMKQRTKVIYQPVFSTEKFTAVSDILVFNKITNTYDLYEVKGSTTDESGGGRKTKDYVIDIAFQKALLDDIGIVIGKMYLIRLNKDYTRFGFLNIEKLFTVEDLSDEVQEILLEVKEKMNTAHYYLSKIDEPAGHCDCILKGRNSHCTTSPYSNDDLPDYPVHAIARIHKNKLIQLIDNGILSIYDVPESFLLSENQRRQVDTAQSGNEFKNKKGIKDFLKTLQYPLSFIDYETYPSALPRFDGYKPYQQIPFQFSLYILLTPDDKPRHFDFIYTESKNPDSSFAEALKSHLPASGSVVVWNDKFEKGINSQLGNRLPHFKVFVENVNSRVVDLMSPFSGKTIVYDHPEFKGSASIKYVLPALVPHLSYKNMHIQEGGTASDTWNKVVSGEYGEQDRKVKIQALKDYCHLDTLAMVEIWKVLNKQI